MHSFAPFFNLKISAKNRHHFFAIEIIEYWIYDFFWRQFFIFSIKFCNFFCECLMIFSGFRAKFQKRVTSVAFQSILRKQIRKLPKILKSVKIIQYHSILFNRVLSCFALLHATPKMAWDAASWGTLREFCSGTPVSLLLFAGGRLPRLLNQSPGPAIRAVWQVFLTCHDTCHMIYCKIQGCRANQIQHCKHNIYMIKKRKWTR